MTLVILSEIPMLLIGIEEPIYDGSHFIRNPENKVNRD